MSLFDFLRGLFERRKPQQSVTIREITNTPQTTEGRKKPSQRKEGAKTESPKSPAKKGEPKQITPLGRIGHTKKETNTKESPKDKPLKPASKAPSKKSPRAEGEKGKKTAPVFTPLKKRERVRFEDTPDITLKNGPLIEDFEAEVWDVSEYNPPLEEGKTLFTELHILPRLLRAVNDMGFQYATDIQSRILPHSLRGEDVTGQAQTGTGKTAAFLLTILQHLITKRPAKPRREGAPRALIMAPTRELVMQIKKDADDLSKHSNARVLAIFGGMDYDKQRDALDGVVDIVIATPGRILDYYKQRGIFLNHVEVLVLDEADRMLDMGFLPDMRRIIAATPPKEERQTMLFSATLPQEISRLASLWLKNPIQVEVEPEQVANINVEQRAYIVSLEDKLTLLINLLFELQVTRAIIFANRKDQVARLTDQLRACDFSADMLTGDVAQTKRIKTLENLRAGRINILVATDVAGRGIHVEGVDAVFNYTLPNDPDDYVHRIGRTGRAGAKGISISFASEDDSYMIAPIEEYIKAPLNYLMPSEELLTPIPEKYLIKLKNMKRRERTQRKPKPLGRPRK